jgi:hypothetical protein
MVSIAHTMRALTGGVNPFELESLRFRSESSRLDACRIRRRNDVVMFLDEGGRFRYSQIVHQHDRRRATGDARDACADSTRFGV